MDPLNLKKTNTTKFILPMIFNDETTYNDILKNHYLDSYTSDYYEPENDGCLLIVKTIDEEPSNTINKPIRKYKRDGTFVFVYEIPDKFKEDFAYILIGSFNDISEEYRQKLLLFWDEDVNSGLSNIITKNYTRKGLYKYDIFEEMYRVRKEYSEEDF
jgi:hypothetical protein